MSIKGQRIFLAGGAGFIGATLAGRLLEFNKVVVYDTLSRNAIKDKPFFNHPNLKVLRGDILDSNKLKEAVHGSSIVLNLAGIAGIDTVIKSPTNTMKVNLLGTANMLERARALAGCNRYIQFSTSEVFGMHARDSKESDETSIGAIGEARWTYAASKLAAEHMAHGFYMEFGLPVVSLRPFNVYGPGQIGEGAIHIFVKKALRNEDILIHGDGKQIRAWCYIDDMVDAILLAIEKEEAVGNVFNIGNPDTSVNVHELASFVIKTLDSGSSIRFTPALSADVRVRIPDIEKARRLLGFNPTVDLEEGIRRTADWYRKE